MKHMQHVNDKSSLAFEEESHDSYQKKKKKASMPGSNTAKFAYFFLILPSLSHLIPISFIHSSCLKKYLICTYEYDSI